MADELYQQAKDVFASLVSASDDVRSDELQKLEAENPELAGEVRSLLDYHTDHSIVVETEGPRVRTRSTLATTYRPGPWERFRLPLLSLAIVLPLLLLGSVILVWVNANIHSALQTQVETSLKSSLEQKTQDFLWWEEATIDEATQWVSNAEVLALVQSVVRKSAAANPDDPDRESQLCDLEESKSLVSELRALSGSDLLAFAIWDRRMLSVCAAGQQGLLQAIVGKYVPAGGVGQVSAVLRGEGQLVLPEASSESSSWRPRIAPGKCCVSPFVPVRDENGVVIAAIMISCDRLQQEYDELLKTWREGPDDVYLVDERGRMLTRGRFLDQLEEAGVRLRSGKTDVSDGRLPLVLDPGVNLVSGERPTEKPETWSRTLLANRLSAGGEEVYLEGYRNYAGVNVVGGWKWLEPKAFGVAVEREYDEAFQVGTAVRNGLYWFAAGIGGLLLLGLLITSSVITAANRRLRDVSEVGPYQIQELLGVGGMGQVYLAEHALLCRQSAVKVLTHRSEDLSVIGRFEREVQLASQLTHPNTIAIYDFGRNKDGLFYYAMEYINGSHLGQLVEYSGPLEPGRCIFILRQLCNALQEAHSVGVVHRDIKPQNIMVCNRGGEPDFVKLFDYGLVKSFAPGVAEESAQTKVVLGTPRFMAPERLASPWLADPRVDVYSVGALAYFLLTAQLPPLVTMDEGHGTQTGVETLDLPPDVIAFGEILSLCLAVEPAMRPSSMNSLVRELNELSREFPWTREDSYKWWREHEPKLLLFVKNKRKALEKQQA